MQEIYDVLVEIGWLLKGLLCVGVVLVFLLWCLIAIAREIRDAVADTANFAKLESARRDSPEESGAR